MIYGNCHFVNPKTSDESLPLEAARRCFYKNKLGFPIIVDESSPMVEAKAASRPYLLMLNFEYSNGRRVVASGSGKSDDFLLSSD